MQDGGPTIDTAPEIPKYFQTTYSFTIIFDASIAYVKPVAINL